MIDPSRRRWWRGLNKHRSPVEPVPATGNARFSPLPATRHMYLGATETVALLESALRGLHEADPKIYLADLVDQVVAPLRTTQPLRLADLRDPELDRLHLERGSLVATTPRHYACTRVWAERLQHRRPGGHQIQGVIWHSRQAELIAGAQRDGLLGDLLAHSQVEVLVLWSPHAPDEPVQGDDTAKPLLDKQGHPTKIVNQLSELLQAPIE